MILTAGGFVVAHMVAVRNSVMEQITKNHEKMTEALAVIERDKVAIENQAKESQQQITENQEKMQNALADVARSKMEIENQAQESQKQVESASEKVEKSSEEMQKIKGLVNMAAALVEDQTPSFITMHLSLYWQCALK
jgi:predicted  nucleic acid-binding Zn-ribbon protein